MQTFDNTKYCRDWWKCQFSVILTWWSTIMSVCTEFHAHPSKVGEIFILWQSGRVFRPALPFEPHCKNTAKAILTKIARLFIHKLFFSPFLRPFHYLSLSSEDNVRSQTHSCYWKQLAVWARLAGTTKVSPASYQVKKLIHSFWEFLRTELTKPASH